MNTTRRDRSGRGAGLSGPASLLAVLAFVIGWPAPLLAQSPADAPTAWQLLNDGDPAPGDGILVYDTVRRVPIRVIGATWELIGDDWVRRFPPEPTPRGLGGSCFAFDPDRGVLVAFGGVNPETWEYDGVFWVQRFPATSPSDRMDCAMVYDAGRRRMVLFGGLDDNSVALGDTWEYDGTNWVLIHPKNHPSARSDVAMAYDANAGKVELFGGWTLVPGAIFGDMWEYDGRNWRQKTPSPLPAARRGAGMAYDPVRRKVVMFGGASSSVVYGDTWEWNGQGWAQVTTPTAPQPRWYFRMDYDLQRGQVIGHGGFPNDGDFNDTWIYNGTTWTQIAISGLPYPRYRFALAYDPVNDEIVLHGGRTTGPDFNLRDTWSFKDGAWHQESPVTQPSVNWDFKLAWDPVELRLIGFSGRNGNALELPQELQEYDSPPPAWTSTPICCAAGRTGYGWVHFPELNRMVLFGGEECCVGTGGAHYLGDDTWLLEGTTWLPLGPIPRPPARSDFAMGYHGGTGQVVLQGGTTTGYPAGKQADTWLFDGAAWQLLEANSPPGARYNNSMIYDAARDRLVMYGDGTALDGITWEFDGAQWLARSTPFQPDSNRCGTPLAYDSKRQDVILFGGRDCAGALYWNDTWAYGPDPDGDGIVGGLDNCPNAPNSNQANADGDAAGDACDCAPADPGSFAPPVEVQGLMLVGSATTNLTWSDQAPLVGSGVVYDVATGLLSILRTSGFAGATCLGSGLATPSATDDRPVAPGDGYWHLVRSHNACGVGTYGPGRATLNAASPCP